MCFDPLVFVSALGAFGGGGISMFRRLWTLCDLEARLCDLEERPVYREGPGAVESQDPEDLSFDCPRLPHSGIWL